MKVISLRKKIIINFAVSTLTVAACAALFYFYLENKNETTEQVNKITAETNQIIGKSSEFKNQTILIDHYKEAWNGLSENQKNTDGIKVDDFNSKLAEIAKKHSITTKEVKINLPETLRDGIFKRETIDIIFTTVSIDFTAINDVMAMSFVNDFSDSLQGYKIITSFELKKTKSYSDQDLRDISSGTNKGFVDGRINFFWYVSKESIKQNY